MIFLQGTGYQLIPLDGELYINHQNVGFQVEVCVSSSFRRDVYTFANLRWAIEYLKLVAQYIDRWSDSSHIIVPLALIEQAQEEIEHDSN